MRPRYTITGDEYLDGLRRKEDQEWDMAGLARQDRDTVDEAKHTEKARELQRQIAEYLGSRS
jgi:glucosamine 6-phosphate synthetase-like amidotransferase/phosphosugar isomerase protein